MNKVRNIYNNDINNYKYIYPSNFYVKNQILQ